LFFTVLSYGQFRSASGGTVPNNRSRQQTDSTFQNGRGDDKKRNLVKAPFTDYKYFTYTNDTLVIDTTLSLKKEYAFNILRKDMFGYQEFANQGKTYTPLKADFEEASIYSKMGTRSKDYNFYNKEDIVYYSVPTPSSEAAYRTGIEQGQFLDVFFTSNFNKQFNASIAYKGLRSLGEYRYSLSSQSALRMTSNYQSKNNRYRLRLHYVGQNLFNEESGGLTEESKISFENEDPNFTDRGRLEVNLNNASSKLEGKRIFVEQSYSFLSTKDSLSQKVTDLNLGYELVYDWRKYRFDQESPQSNGIFGPSYTNDAVEDKTWLEEVDNKVYLNFNSPYVLGDFEVYAKVKDYSYRFNRITITEDQNLLPNKLDGTLFSLGSSWKAQIKKFKLDANIQSIISGNLSGNEFRVKAQYQKDSLTYIGGSLSIQSKSPDYNYRLYQSDLQNFNWYNPNLENENIRVISGFLGSKWGKIDASYSQIDNFTYFLGNEAPQVSQLTGGTVNYLKAGVYKDFKLGKFGFDNSILYQNVIEGDEAFKVPDWVLRNTLYFSSFVFKGKPMYLQTGITFKYFSSFYADALNPVLGTFVRQNQEQIGDYPVFDFFINAQVKRTKIFFKIENLTSTFLEPNYYSSPLYPYRDWRIRFGLVWNWFN
jgi:hypothetical protein